jgi:hypothetical protein
MTASPPALAPSFASRRARASIAIGGLLLSACSSTLPPPTAGAPGELRAQSPVPACVTPLVSGATKSGGMARSLREDELWKTVFPEFSSWRLPAGARACNGTSIAPSSSESLAVSEGSMLVGGGADRMRVAWLPVAGTADKTVGALALYRSRGPIAEVFAVGPLEAARARTKLGIERLGADVLVTVTDEGCAKKTPGVDCETRTSLYAPRHGHLVSLATYALEKIAYVVGGEPGITGRVTYHLEAAVRFEKTAIRISEQMSVSDEAGAALRKIQQERAYAPQGEALVAEGDALSVTQPAK